MIFNYTNSVFRKYRATSLSPFQLTLHKISICNIFTSLTKYSVVSVTQPTFALHIFQSNATNFVPSALYYFFRFDTIRLHGLLLRGFAITPIGHTTVSRTLLDEWSARRWDP